MNLMEQYKFYMDHKINLGAKLIQYVIQNGLAQWHDRTVPKLTNNQIKEVFNSSGGYSALNYSIWTCKYKDDKYHLVAAKDESEACAVVYRKANHLVLKMHDFTDKSLHRPLPTFCGGDILLSQINYSEPFYIGLYDRKQAAVIISAETKKHLSLKEIYGV